MRYLLLLVPFVALLVLLLSLPVPREPASTIAIPPYLPPKGYVCYRAAQPIRIDGKLDDLAWQAAPWTDDFVDIEGDQKPKPRFRTRVKMLWDDACLYIAAELEEPHLQATATKRDAYIFHHDNDFEVFLDPDGDNHLYAELEMNALNTTWDLLLTKPYKDKGHAIDAWDITGLRTAVHLDGTLNDPRDTDKGWTLEIAWPWQGLAALTLQPVPPRDGDQWRINFSRVEWEFDIVNGKYRQRKGKQSDGSLWAEANWVWSPQHAVNMHLPDRWGYLQFSNAAPGTATFRPDPYGLARHVLHQLHDAQALYRLKHQRWASTPAALGFGNLRIPSLSGLRLDVTPQFYEASIDIATPSGDRATWTINADARISRRR